MGLMDTPGGRSRMMRGNQNRANAAYNQGGRLREETRVPERFRASAGSGTNFSPGLTLPPSSKRAPANSDIQTPPATTPETTRETNAPLAIAPFMPSIMKTFHEKHGYDRASPNRNGKEHRNLRGDR